MSYDIEVTEVNPQRVAAVRMHTNLERIGADIQSAFGTLMVGLGRAGAFPAGEPFMIYHDVIDEETAGDIELCVPVAANFGGDDSVKVRELEGGRMATTLHRGPYEEISRAYQMLMHWIGEQDLEMAGPPREIYLNDPNQVAPEELKTRVEWPVCTKEN